MSPHSHLHQALTIGAANVLRGIKPVLLPRAAVGCFAVVCPGQPQARGPEQGGDPTVLPPLFRCWGPASRAFTPRTPIFTALHLVIALRALFSSPEDLLSPKSFLRGYTNSSGTH